MSKRLILLFIAVALSSCSKIPQLGPATANQLATASEEDCGYVQNSYGQRVSWKSNTPVTFYILPSFPADYEQAVRDAMKTWEDAAGRSLFTLTRIDSTDYNGQFDTPSLTDSKNIIYLMSDWDSQQQTTQAITNLRWYNNNIVDADIKLDAAYYQFYTSTVPNTSSEIHLKSLVLHELGHALGLKHKSVLPTVMWATLAASYVRDQLSASDIASLKCEYP